MNLVWAMPLVQDRSVDLLTNSPAHYHCDMIAPRDDNASVDFSYVIMVAYKNNRFGISYNYFFVVVFGSLEIYLHSPTSVL